MIKELLLDIRKLCKALWGIPKRLYLDTDPFRTHLQGRGTDFIGESEVEPIEWQILQICQAIVHLLYRANRK